MSKKICPLVCKSIFFLNFSSEKIPIPMNAFRYNTNNCPHDHVVMFFTHTVFPELELTLMLQKTNRIYFHPNREEFVQNNITLLNLMHRKRLVCGIFFGKNHALCTIPVQLNMLQTMPKSNEL
jgi:hypothetical protein